MARSYQLACFPGSLTSLAGHTVAGGSRIKIRNEHATEPIFLGGDENQLPTALGGSALTAGTGYRLAAGATTDLVLGNGEALYGVSGTSTVTCTVSIFSSNFRG